MQQLDLFSATRLPYRPFCANELPGKLLMKELALALAYRHIQLNPPNAVHWIVIDIDAPVISDPISKQMKAILDGDVPTPNFLAVNPLNGRAHAYYALERAVAKGDHASMKAMRFVAAIEAALIRALGGDPTYAGLIAKTRSTGTGICAICIRSRTRCTSWKMAWICPGRTSLPSAKRRKTKAVRAAT